MEDRTVEVRCLELFFARRTRPLLNRTIVHTGGGCLPTVNERWGQSRDASPPCPENGTINYSVDTFTGIHSQKVIGVLGS